MKIVTHKPVTTSIKKVEEPKKKPVKKQAPKKIEEPVIENNIVTIEEEY